MRIGRFCPSFVACQNQNKIFAIGGFDSDYDCLSSVEVYNVDTNQWKPANPMVQNQCLSILSVNHF
jgi:hypothetical protein